jgi:hypothetical protein
MVLVLSAAANGSQFVKREVERAVTKGRPVIPVRVEPVLPSAELELFVSGTHWIDAWSGDLARHMDRLVRDLTEGPLATAMSAAPPVPLTSGADSGRARKTRRVVTGGAAFILVTAVGTVAYRYAGDEAARERSVDPATAPAPVQAPATERLAVDASKDPPSSASPTTTAASTSQETTRSRDAARRARIVQRPETASPAVPAAQQVTSPEPAQQPAELEALEELRQQATALALRAQVVDASLNRLAEQMRPNGLRGDVGFRQQSVASALANGQRALDQRNVAAAAKYFDVARGDVEFLERFLGR